MMEKIGDCWDEPTVETIIELLTKYKELFSWTFMKMKGIKEEVGTMKIQVKEGTKPIRKWSYHPNPSMKKRVKTELDNMLAA